MSAWRWPPARRWPAQLQEGAWEAYGRVLGAAGEGNAAFLPAGVAVGAVEVDVEVPVVCSEGAAALPLWRRQAQWACSSHGTGSPAPPTHVFLGEVDEVLQVDVVAVGADVVVDEQVELVLDPVLEDEGQHAGGQLQEEDDAQKDGELRHRADGGGSG